MSESGERGRLLVVSAHTGDFVWRAGGADLGLEYVSAAEFAGREP